MNDDDLRRALRHPRLVPRGRSVIAIDENGVVHLTNDRGLHAMMTQEIAAQLIEDPRALAAPLSDEKAAEINDLVWRRNDGFIADRIVPVIEGRNRAECRANAARMRKR